MTTPLVDALTAHIDTILQDNDERLARLEGNFYQRMPEEQRHATIRSAIQALIADLAGQSSVDTYYREIALKRARNPAYRIGSFKEVHLALYASMQNILSQLYGDETAEYADALHRINEVMLRSAAAFYEAYTLERETALREREAELEASAEEQEKLVSILRELSSPIVPVHDSILVLPLVGAIDTSRAQTITEDLLEAIVQRQADLVIIDITGVPVVDTSIANYLLQTTKAVNLLGAQVILVGISAEVAQTIVGLDLDLNRLTVRANLQDGIDHALGQLGLQITPIHSAAKARV